MQDIKPANILINTKGQCKLADFGVHRVVQSHSDTAGSSGLINTFVGSVGYMSPERLSGATYGCPSDIWSLGLVLIAVCIGAHPLEALSQGGYWAMLVELTEGPPPALPAQLPVPDSFRTMLTSMLHTDPANRATSAQLLECSFLFGGDI